MAGFDQGVGATFFDLNSLQVLHITQDEHVVLTCRATAALCLTTHPCSFRFLRQHRDKRTEVRNPLKLGPSAGCCNFDCAYT